MKISYNWLNDYIDLTGFSIDKISEIMTSLGLEVAGVEEVESVKGGLEGIVIGKVISCEKHPNADKLSVTSVDVGKEELLHIVCGAPNVAEGQTVPVATIGSTLYSSEGEAWTIKKGKIRGEVSEGMICAEDELGLGSSHDGIMILPETIKPGTAAKEYFEVEKDVVFDIDLTPNRSDATSHIGVAQDLAAYLKVNEGHSGEVKLPMINDFLQDDHALKIEVEVEDTKSCPRYSGVTLTDVEIKESPLWMQNRLKAIGVRPISNIVDITNYILHELGQPLHAFDADKIPGGRIRVKKLPQDTSFVTLDEVERKLSADDLMICGDDSKGLCIAGVFGGMDSGVTEMTRNIFLESAHFAAIDVRKTSMNHILRTDAAMVFEKGSDPSVTVLAMKRAAMFIREFGGGKISSEIVDVYPERIENAKVKVSFVNIDRLIGIHLDREKIAEIFEALNMDILKEDEKGMEVSVPSNKADVTREADIIEEILRIYGLNNVPAPEKVAISIAHGERKENYKIRKYLSEYLAGQSFHEAMSLSLAGSKKYLDSGIIPKEKLVFINNTSNVELDVLRPEMMFSALDNLAYNQNRQQRDLLLFEFGKHYLMDGEQVVEEEMLTLAGMGQVDQKNWSRPEMEMVDFYLLKSHVHNILNKMNIGSVSLEMLEDQRFDYCAVFKLGNLELAKIGKVANGINKFFGIKQEVFYAEIHFERLIEKSEEQLTVQEISKFPGVSRDLALVIDKSRKFEEIRTLAHKTIKKSLKSLDLFDVYDNEEQLGSGKISYAVSLKFEDVNKTMKDKEVDKLMQKYIYKLEQNLNVQIRK